MSKYINIIIMVVLCLVLSAGLFLLNDINLDIRLMELKQYLQKSNKKENSSIDHIDLVMKYKINTMKYDDKISIDEADIIENQINLIIASKNIDEKIENDKYDSLLRPALYLINVNRYFIGKPPVVSTFRKERTSHVEIAYYYERNNYYKNALEYYAKAFSPGLPRGQMAASIMLHQGYCNALLGKYHPAKKLYHRVIDEYTGEMITVTAAILLNYLEGFYTEYRKILKSKDSVSKGVKLFNLMAYKESLRVLKKVEKRASPEDKERIQYYKALCFRETGQTKKSVNTFVEIIAGNPNSKYARSANRKVYIIGSRLGRDNKLKKIALKTNRVIKDKTFDRMVKDESNFRSYASGKPASEIDSDNGKIIKDGSGLEKVTIKKSLLKKLHKKVLLKKIDEKVSSKKVTKVDLMKRIRLSKFTRKKIMIIDKSGNIFIGTVKKGSKNSVLIKTDIGIVKIQRKQIRFINEMGSFQIK